MKLGISQLAFKTQSELIDSVNYLKREEISNIEIVLPKIINWNDVNLFTLQNYVKSLWDVGLTCTSTQSITFNTSLTSFLSEDFFHHISEVSKLCKIINVNTIVLGAPKLRDIYNKNNLSYIFKRIDSLLKDNNQILCIEPNCTSYGGKFFITLDEIIYFLKINSFTNIKTMIDSHNLLQENLNPTQEYIKHKEYIHHIHVSEIGLDLFKQSDVHYEFSQCLRENKYNKSITYEVINQKSISMLLESISQFKNIYN